MKSASETQKDLIDAADKVSELVVTIEKQNRRIEELNGRPGNAQDAVYICLDGSIKIGPLHVDPARQFRPLDRVCELVSVHERLVPSRVRDFRLIGQVGNLYMYGEV